MENRVTGEEEAEEQNLQRTGNIGCGYLKIITRCVKNSVGDSGRETSAETIKKRRDERDGTCGAPGHGSLSVSRVSCL